MKTIVLGGYGNFGARIVRALAGTPGIDLTVAGRNLAKAQQLASAVGTQAAMIDANRADLTEVLRAAGAELVIHTAGPFQAQGYGVAHAVAASGAHYIDLADGRRFVCDFPAALDHSFRAQKRLAITGVSTVPALSSAVIEHLCAGWQRILDIDMVIGPAQTAPRGVATMAAVLSYCGAPIKVWQQGRWSTQYGWSTPSTVTFARLKPRLAALCDIPDLELFPARYPGIQTVQFRAALELGINMRGMAALAALRRRGILQQPTKLAGLLDRASNLLDPFGSAVGAMVVRVQGLDAAGAPVQRSWNITAGDDNGPEIPCMPAILLARKLAAGTLNTIGAVTSTGLLALEEFAPLFKQWDMHSDFGT